MKFGKVSKEELNMTVYPADSSAHAAILYDFGKTEFRYDVHNDKGWQLIFNRKMRIKILDKEGVSSADFRFKLYHDGTASKEKLEDIEGITFNLEDGKVVKTKLERDNVMETEEDKNHTSYSFAMPNVRAGSVIDVTYRIRSDFMMNLQPWHFQSTIPTVWSEYYVEIPEYFAYKQTLTGYNTLTVNERTEGRGSITFTTKDRNNGRVTSTTYERETVEYSTKRFKMAMKDVPAFKEEDYLTTPNNYLSIFSFELASVKTDEVNYKNYTETWEKINELLLDHQDFGKAIGRHGYLKDDLEMALNGLTGETEKLEAVLAMIKTRIRWDEHNALTADDLKEAWNKKRGSSGEINLALISALRMAGLQADPVALSTRSNGILNPVHPTITDFNYVVARVVAGGDTLLVDATEPLAPAGLLPVRCLNDKGRLITTNAPRWINLNPVVKTKRSGSYTVKIDADGNITGTAQIGREGYEALDFRKQMAAAASQDDFYKEKAKLTEGLSITTHALTGIDSLAKPLNESFDFTIADALDLNTGLILINPIIFEATKNNPFKLKERSYPVEFPYPFNETLMFTWTIPDGYAVDHLPVPALVILPEKGGKFTYNVVQNGNTITVISIINLNQTTFVSSQYEYIKTFFAQIVAKHAETIVLKKI